MQLGNRKQKTDRDLWKVIKMNFVLSRVNTLRKIKGLLRSNKAIFYRKKTGIPAETYSKLSNNRSIEHVVYSSSSGLSADDLVNVELIVSKEGSKSILKWLGRPNYKLFAIKINGELGHFCLVVICKKGGFFGMAHEGDLAIMTCNTLEKYRRQGLYKTNLQYICSSWQVSKWAYINIRPENIFSQKGVEAAGFERMGTYSFFKIGRLGARVRKCGN